MYAEIISTNTTPLFEKRTVAELSELEMMHVDGGSTIACAMWAAGASSEVCGAAVAVAIIYVFG